MKILFDFRKRLYVDPQLLLDFHQDFWRQIHKLLDLTAFEKSFEDDSKNTLYQWWNLFFLQLSLEALVDLECFLLIPNMHFECHFLLILSVDIVESCLQSLLNIPQIEEHYVCCAVVNWQSKFQMVIQLIILRLHQPRLVLSVLDVLLYKVFVLHSILKQSCHSHFLKRWWNFDFQLLLSGAGRCHVLHHLIQNS